MLVYLKNENYVSWMCCFYSLQGLASVKTLVVAPKSYQDIFRQLPDYPNTAQSWATSDAGGASVIMYLKRVKITAQQLWERSEKNVKQTSRSEKKEGKKVPRNKWISSASSSLCNKTHKCSKTIILCLNPSIHRLLDMKDCFLSWHLFQIRAIEKNCSGSRSLT